MGDLLYGNAGAVIIYLNMYELTMDKKYILRAEIAANYILKNLKEKYSIFNNIEVIKFLGWIGGLHMEVADIVFVLQDYLEKQRRGNI